MEDQTVATRCPTLPPFISRLCDLLRHNQRRPKNHSSSQESPYFSPSNNNTMVLHSSNQSLDFNGIIDSTFASRYAQTTLPRFKLPDKSIPKEAAYQIIKDDLMLDGSPRLNLASFVTTWMEPECDKLILESINKNFVDMEEYPITTEIQNRCVNMIATLFHAPLKEDEGAIGCATVGSSEAIMLAGLAFKRKWQNKRKAQGKSFDKPNIVTGSNVQKLMISDIKDHLEWLLANTFENCKSSDEASPSGLMDNFSSPTGLPALTLILAVQVYAVLHDILSSEAQATLRNYLQNIIYEDDEKLKQLKDILGKEVCNSVIAALKELNEYNAHGRYPTRTAPHLIQ